MYIFFKKRQQQETCRSGQGCVCGGGSGRKTLGFKPMQRTMGQQLKNAESGRNSLLREEWTNWLSNTKHSTLKAYMQVTL